MDLALNNLLLLICHKTKAIGSVPVYYVELKPLFDPLSVDCPHSINCKVLSYCKYFLLFLTVVRIEPATSREELANQTSYPQHHFSLPPI